MLRLLTTGALIAAAIAPVPAAPAAESDIATISDSGSTNRAGYRIVVDQAGLAEWTLTPRRFGASQEQDKPVRRSLPHILIERFQDDLKAAEPFASLPEVHCMKSVSFGSRLTISVEGEQTPDLSCGDGGNAAMRNLIRDAKEIIALFRAN